MGKFQKGMSRLDGAGRKAGTPNKITKELREVLNDVVEESASNIQTWLDRVASDDPARALELYLKMSEYVIPKLSRVEHEGSYMNLSISEILRDIDGQTTGILKISNMDGDNSY